MVEVLKKTPFGILAAAAVLLAVTGCRSADVELPSAEPLTPYRLATYSASDAGDGSPRPAIVVGQTILDLAASDALFATETGSPPFDFSTELIGVIAAGDRSTARLNQIANRFDGREDGFRFRIEPHRLTAPLLYPSNLLAAAANYRSHATEMDVEQEVDPDRDAPYLFAKSARSGIIGTGDPYRIPPGRDQIDWEGELGVVIGKTATRVPLERALDHVFGYTIVFDVSDRGGRYRENPMLSGPDWFSGKSGDRAAPMGPYLTPSAFLPDPQALRLTTRIDDRIVQDDTTANMIYSVAHLIAYASTIMTLHPGDVIATGTPDGVGAAREPPEFLRPGQTVHIEIEGIGTLSIPIEAEPES